MDRPRPIRLRFASFEVDLATHQVFQDGREIHMQGKPFQFLATLLRHHGEVVSREAMSHSLWPDIYVQVNQGLNAAARKARMLLNDDAMNPRFIETLGSKGYRFIYPTEVLKWSTEMAGVPEEPIRVAVLSLKANDPESAILASGLTRELASHFAAAHPKLTVAAEPEMSALLVSRAHPETLQKIRNIRYVVSGTFAMSAGRVELGLALTSVADGEQIWEERFEGPARELPHILEKARERFLRSFRNLPPVTPSPLFKTEFKSYQEYLKARHHQSRQTISELREAVAHYQKCTESDNEFAPAFLGLAEVYNSIGVHGWMQPRAAYSKALEAGKRAMQLEPRNADAMIAVGWSALTLDRDWATATRLFERALQINPNAIMGYCYYSYLLFSRGRVDDGVAALAKASRVEPGSVFINSRLASMYYFARRYDEAIRQARTTLVLDEHHPRTREFLGLSFLAQRRYTEALEQLELAAKNSNGDGVILAELAYAQAIAGRFPVAESIIQQLEHSNGHGAPPAYQIGLVKLALGNVNESFRWIEAAYEHCWHWILLMPQDPRLDILRGTRRYEQLCKMLSPAELKRAVNSN